MDYLFFTAAVVGAFVLLGAWLGRGGPNRRFPPPLWYVLGGLLLAGWFITEAVGRNAHQQIRSMVEGFPPTYAHELERMGHAGISAATAADDPAYLAMIAAQVRWEKVNPSVADIYTMQKLPDGRIVLLVDSETDYDRDGNFTGEREQRTSIGEVFEKTIPALEKALAGTPAFTEDVYSDRWGQWVSAFVPMHDATGQVKAVLGVDFPAETWIAARRYARMVSMGAVLLFALLLAAAATVITLLRAHLTHRAEAEERLNRLNGELERRVLDRTAQLEATHAQLIDASHHAGMAEVASNVLHNIGNVLSSVNVSAGVISDRVRGSRLSRLGDICALLRQHESDLPAFFAPGAKGAKIPAFLEALNEQRTHEHDAIAREASALHKNIEHINAILQMQQSMARKTGVPEPVQLTELVDDAIAINAHSFSQADTTLVRDYRVQPGITLEKHKALQILVNLIRNARQACEATERSDRQITVRIVEEAGRILVAVCDNGVGFSDATRAKMFSHGFTTKKNGNGFGLHSAARAARELGGALNAESGGPGLGATFTLTLPGVPVAKEEPALSSSP